MASSCSSLYHLFIVSSIQSYSLIHFVPLPVSLSSALSAFPSYPLSVPLSFTPTCNRQLLFIERLLYSAEIKYLTAYLLTEAAVRKQQKDIGRKQIRNPSVFEGTNSDLFSKYASSLKSYSIMNAALCRSHRIVKKIKSPLEGYNKFDDNAPMAGQSTTENVNNKCIGQRASLADHCMHISSVDSIDLMNLISMDPNSMNMRYRRVAIFEKLLK